MFFEIGVPAKLNLFLAVTGQREDGYHTLASLFWPLAEPGDLLSLDYDPSGSGIRLAVTGGASDVPCDRRNLVWKAAEKYLERAGNPGGSFSFSLKKGIPSAAGMGGGSSDAAAVLLLLQEALGLLRPEELAQTALKLGADVPFFLHPSPALVTGIGEELSPLETGLELPPALVVSPNFPVSAKWAYEHLDHEKLTDSAAAKARIAELTAALKARDFEGAGKLLHNDLSKALYDKFPLLELCRKRLFDLGSCGAEVTGSGSSMFAFFRNDGERDAACAALKASYPAEELGIRKALSLPPRSPALFLDRDGVVNEEVGYLHDPAEVKLIPGAAAAIRKARQAGYGIVIVTNQSVVPRGMGSEAEVHAVNDAIENLLRKEGAAVDFWECCFHHPEFTGPCGCRKPKPGMLLRAARKGHFDLARSVMVGDRESDLAAGVAAGCRRTALVKTGYGRKTLENALLPKNTPVFNDLAAVVGAFCGGEGKPF